MNFYKPRRPSKFRYVYRYYDPKKEEMERKIRRAERKLNPDAPITPEEVKENLEGAFRRQSKILRKYGDDDNVGQTIAEKNRKLILYLVLLAVLLLWLVRSSGISHFFGALGYYF
ncbi:MAG: hypothetical protein Q4D93_03335 [Porphyromonas sp.]|nr:hypothetical protein [Porphyromonas sp.]